MELKPGDVVTLKSGGHPLTVVEVNADSVSCLWMGSEGDLFRETFAAGRAGTHRSRGFGRRRRG